VNSSARWTSTPAAPDQRALRWAGNERGAARTTTPTTWAAVDVVDAQGEAREEASRVVVCESRRNLAGTPVADASDVADSLAGLDCAEVEGTGYWAWIGTNQLLCHGNPFPRRPTLLCSRASPLARVKDWLLDRGSDGFFPGTVFE
jgi:hypothetical protein